MCPDGETTARRGSTSLAACVGKIVNIITWLIAPILLAFHSVMVPHCIIIHYISIEN